MSIVVHVEGELREWIERRARETRIEPDAFAIPILQRALDCDQARFERAMKETLEKNRELYRRLAKVPE